MSSAARKRCATPGRNQHRDTNVRAKRSLEDNDAVEVVCRLTPYYGPTPCLVVAEENVIRVLPPPGMQKRDGSPYPQKDFEFGFVFDENDRQQAVFERCATDLIEHLLAGKNGLLFTYGVTGSGKTYTMTGKPTADETGLLPRTLDVVFNSIDNKVDRCIFYPNGRNGFGIRSKMEAHLARKKVELERLQATNEIENRYMERKVVSGYNDNYVCAVFVSYVEIYNNYCYDLLEPKGILTKRDTRVDMNNMVYVEGAQEVEVETSDEALELFCRGEERRRTSDTVLNKESSRSHSVFTIRLVMAPFEKTTFAMYPDDDPNGIVVSQLSLVDLAGSERTKRTNNIGDRLVEAASINKSLMVLRQCIDKLRRNQRSGAFETIPYRDSKLTMLFKNFFEGSGKIRMIICANPKPADFEENLNVLAFAEESQSVRITRAEDRLETDPGARPPVPRRFFSRWNYEIDNLVASLPSLSNTKLFGDFCVKDCNDSASIAKLKERCLALANVTNRENHDFGSQVRDAEIPLRNALCVADYARVEMKELRSRAEQDADQIASYCAENKKLKREIMSLRERLSRYEAEDEELVTAEEQLRRSVREERSRARKQDQKLKVIQDICDAPSPSFAQLRSKFSTGNDTPASTAMQKRKVTATPSTQAGSSRESRRPQAEPRTGGGPGFFNPKYHRRSKSAPRVLDHQPTNRVPTGGILRVKLPSNAKHVTKPEAHQLQKSSEYVLTHQEVDEEGNINTSLIKNHLRVHLKSLKSLETSSNSAGENTSTSSDADVFSKGGIPKEVKGFGTTLTNGHIKKLKTSERIKIFRQWMADVDEDERKMFIRELLSDCDLPNLEYISMLISRLRVARSRPTSNGSKDPLTLLPSHIVLRIMSHLDPVSLCRSSRVSRYWRHVCSEPMLWRALCQLPREFRLCSAEAESSQLRNHTSECGTVRWKDAFSERYRLWRNWHAGRCVVRTFTGHTQGITCVQFDDDRIVSGSSDTTIRIWDLRGSSDVGNLGTMALNGHSATVRCLDLNGNVLASGSNDFSIKIWNVDVNPRWSSIGCRKTMLGHSNYVRCLQMDHEHLISGSYDMHLKLWSLSTGACVRTLIGHNDAVLCVQYRDRESLAVSGSADNSIKCWDTRTGRAEMTIHNAHDNAVTCVRFDDHRIVSGSVDRMIKMWDVRTGKCMHTIDWKLAEGHTGVVRCLQVDTWRIVSAADDRTIKVWNVDSLQRLCTLHSHEDGVTCVQFSDRQIVSGSYDKTVKLWDFSRF
ncbi:hypothetical protein RB195_001042 [Necator americanus]|uniref:Kinesin motor domain protein n=1 Tax=Necator americanus TaxID=51031 RepID=A0ABR1DCH6_NECAM